MRYSEFVDLYESLGATSGRLDKIKIVADFLKKIKKVGKSEWIYLLLGRVVPDYDTRELGISRQLAFKAIASALGIKPEKIIESFNKIGDLGEIAEQFLNKRKQVALFSKTLTVQKVFDNLSKIMTLEGKGSVDKKLDLVSELLASASGKEAKYIVRTIVSDLRIGVAEGVIKEAVSEAFFEGEKETMVPKIEEAYDLVNDWAVVLDAAEKGKKELEKIEIIPGRPMKVMLAVKAENIEDGFRICGRPAAFEYKYDGFRVLINSDGKNIKLFTRKLEEVTKQFPDVIAAVKEHIHGKSFIIDSEVVGFDPKTKKYKPFEAMSQRIKRKYNIDELVKKLPVEINVFDVIYYNGKKMIDEPFSERRKVIEKIVREERWKIRTAEQLVTDDEEKAKKFYEEALEAGEEGVMIKKIDAPYRQGRRVGYLAKLKPSTQDLDLVIIGAEYGSGKRAGWLSSFIVACEDDGKFLEVGKVSSGLKEIEGEEGTTYEEMTEILKPIIIDKKGNYVKVKPKAIVSVTYQNIQKSPSYDSGFALRFPRISAYRPDRNTGDIASLKDIEKEARKAER